MPIYQTISLQFYTIQANILSDSDAFLNLFSQLYPGCLESNHEEHQQTLSFKVFTSPNNPFGFPALVIDDEIYPLENPMADLAAFHYFIMRKIRESLETHFLIHGGAVSRKGKGILLVGDPYFGKTTLVLELVRRGYAFLSDEIAAISRSDKKVHPYPRCLSIRPTTYQNLGITIDSSVNQWFGNHLLDIDALYPGSKGSAIPIDTICILSDPAIMPETVGTSSTRLLHIWVANPSPAYHSALSTLNSTADFVIREKTESSLITLTTNDPEGVKAQVRNLSTELGLNLVGISSRVVHKPVFTSPPRLQPIPHSLAVRFLFQRFLGGRSALLKSTPGGRPALLFAELMDLIRTADCYTLSVGPLDQMVKLIDEIT